MPHPATIKAARKALDKALADKVGASEVDEVGFFPDTETDGSLTWNCTYRDSTFRLRCDYKTKKVVYLKGAGDYDKPFGGGDISKLLPRRC
jgi:hypothetical protein